MSERDRTIELLKVWYAIFAAIIDKPESEHADLDRLRRLRQRIREEAPELEVN